MAITYEEIYYLPQELIGIIEESVLDKLFGKTLWYMTAREDSLLGVAIYSIMPDKEHAILEYFYTKENSGIDVGLMEKSLAALKEHSIMTVSVVLEKKDEENSYLRSYFEKHTEFTRTKLVSYDYSQMQEVDITANLEELEIYTSDIGYLDNAEDPDAWDVRDILRNMGILYSIHEQNDGVGRFCLDDNKKLIGVAFGRRDEEGDYFITDYYDSEGKKNLSVYRKIILAMIMDYLSDSNSDSSINIICCNDMMEDFLQRNFGIAKEQVPLEIGTLNL